MAFFPLSEPLHRALTDLAPAGFRLVRRARIADRKKDIFDNMPPEWIELYARRGYALGDPVFLWSMFNEGTIRWSEITYKDYRGVLEEAKDYGLMYGAITARTQKGRLSALSISRDDREFTNDELLECSKLLDEALNEVQQIALLQPAEIDVLRDLADGLSLEASAKKAGVAISTVKNRLNRARLALDSKTSTQAVAEAMRRRML